MSRSADALMRYARSKPKYSIEQKKLAGDHYFDHGRCVTVTIKALRYPGRDSLTTWIDELHPEATKRLVGRAGSVSRSAGLKRAAVIDLCTRQGSAEKVAEQVGVSRPTLYNWKKQLLGREVPAPENLVDRGFHATAPNEKWLTDITEFQIPAGKVYLSPMVDCFDGLVVSWSIGTRPEAEFVNTMLNAAVEAVADSTTRPIVHSDRGAHYCWPGWLARMRDARLTRSMSRKGCSPDNAACEGFFGRLKTELFYPRKRQAFTIEQFIQALDSYSRWYNEKRIKVSLGSLSPLEYRESLGITA